MAGIDTGGGHGGKRSTNHEIPLIPFIDFLLCLVMFLLVTAVWNHMARIQADANVPGKPKDEPEDKIEKEKELHVEMTGERRFQLKWQEGTTVLNTIDVERKPVEVGQDITYPDLAEKIQKEWQANGSHKATSDKKFDRAILHTDNSTEFAHVIAVLDAIYAAKRKYDVGGGKLEDFAAFQVTFAAK
jgi:biopolymer transport protein ExbD